MKSRCYNRPPRAAGRMQVGINRDTGARVETYLVNDWFEDRCTQRDGRGVGPNGESYADANNFNCEGCRWYEG